ncbi:MAG TPA: tRNA lysidine(34) synthetase TilS [Spirillospora sp.]|nr:tRNA lysidine(34) synthetase TilS [Spirillospora sp.]
MSLAELVCQTTLKLIAPGDKLVIGVSGGADSLTLLRILHTSGQFDLHVATLDHGLRGAAGAADVQFVMDTCAAWGIPVTAGKRTDLPKDAGVEEAARAARYDFLAETARQVGAAVVAVGHHADDQAETVLMRLIRGTGLQGLSGMAQRAPLPGHPDLTLIRPLLHITRREIEAYCSAHNLQPRHDITNTDTRLLRNRVRLELLPRLRQINPQIERALTRLAASAALDSDYIQQQLERAIAGRVSQDDQRVTLDLGTFRGLHPALQGRFVLWAVQQIGGQDASHERITGAVGLAVSGTTGQQTPLPGGLRLRLDYETLHIEQADAPLPLPDIPLLPPDTLIAVAVPGETPLPGSDWTLRASRTPSDDALRLIVADGQAVHLRTRRPGDRFAPPGLEGHTRKIKEWMIDHRVPQAARARIPLLTIDGEIAAVMVGSKSVVSESFAAYKSDAPVVYFQFIRRAHS